MAWRSTWPNGQPGGAQVTTTRPVLVVVLLAALLASAAPHATSDALDERHMTALPAQVTSNGSIGALAVAYAAAPAALRAAAEQAMPSDDAAALAAVASGSISGTVLGEDGVPLAGICVAALTAPLEQAAGFEAVASTGTAGEYTLSGLAPGTYRLLFLDCREVPTYAIEYYPASATFGDAMPIELAAGQELIDADIRMIPGASVAGTVIDAATGAPAAGVCVGSFDPAFRIQLAVATDAAGGYTLRGLRPGEHVIAFVDCTDTPRLAIEWWPTSPSFSGATSLELAAGEQRAGVGAVLVAGGAITGEVTTDAGMPVGDICAVVIAEDGGLMTYAVTAADGRYRIPTVRSGAHRILFQDCGAFEPRYEERWYRAGGSFEAADLVLVQPPAITAGIDVALAPIQAGADPDPDAADGPPPVDAALPPGLDDPEGPPDDVDVPPDDEVPSPPGVDDVDEVPDLGEAPLCPEEGLPPSGMVDVIDNVHEAAIDCVSMLGITLGVSQEQFAPTLVVRRDQMASFVARMIEALGVTLPAPTDQGFTDIADNVHADSINRLAAFGVAGGVSSSSFDPASPVRRDQMATFLARAIEAIVGEEMPSAGTAFADTADNVHGANIDRVAAAGITLGVGDGSRYEPSGHVRRDQMASFLARAINHVSLDGHAVPPTVAMADDAVGLSQSRSAQALRTLAPAATICVSNLTGREITVRQSRFQYQKVWVLRWNSAVRELQLYAESPWMPYYFPPVRYTNVAPGYYITLVRGSNGFGPASWVEPVVYGSRTGYVERGTSWSWNYCQVR